MKTVKTTIIAILLASAGSLAGQQEFDQTAYLYSAGSETSVSTKSVTVKENYSAKAEFTLSFSQAASAFENANFEHAAELYESAAALSPRSIESHVGAGVSRYLSGNNALARIHFISALKLDPDHAESHFGLARVQIETGDFADVCEHLRYAVAGGLEEARAVMDQYCDETQAEARGDYRDF